MEYDEREIRELIEATLRDNDLEGLCQNLFPKFHKSLAGECRSVKNIKLAEYVYMHGEVDVLFKEIERINPNGYRKRINPLQEYEIHNFDLISPIEDCLEKINHNRGLICLLLPCVDDELFMISFSERLKEELLRSKYDASTEKPLTVSIKGGGKISSVGDKIGYKYKKLTNDNIVIFPVGINECNKAKDISNFLKHIQKAFEKTPNFCSIIIMFGKDNFLYPPSVIFLASPELKKYDFSKWINMLIGSFISKHGKKEWKEEWKKTRDLWIDMVSETFSEQDKDLKLDSLYDHLKDTLEYLREEPEISSEEFLERVKKGLNNYKLEEEYYHV